MYCFCNTPNFLVTSTEFSASDLKEILVNSNKPLQKKRFHLTLLKSPSLIYGLNISNRYLLEVESLHRMLLIGIESKNIYRYDLLTI